MASGVIKQLPIRLICSMDLGYYKATATNVWEYIGTSITVPSGHMYIGKYDVGWNSGKPIGMGFHTSSSITSPYDAPRYAVTNGSLAVYDGTFALNPGKWYAFEMRSNIPGSANPHTFYYIDIG